MNVWINVKMNIWGMLMLGVNVGMLGVNVLIGAMLGVDVEIGKC